MLMAFYGLSNCGSSGLEIIETVTKRNTWIRVLLDWSQRWNINVLDVLMLVSSHSLIPQSCNISRMFVLGCSLVLIKFGLWWFHLVYLCLILGYLSFAIKMELFWRMVMGKNLSRWAWARHSHRPLLSQGSFSFLNVIVDQIVVYHWIVWVKCRSLHFALFKIQIFYQI